ncbi:hypothetical protein [Aquimarina longa]|uniref:hypothetical protein n=1 Tax=Aquimarina longa TaxID=1080221 RepID=UPI000780848D|nr:hypothetical protein [Aquimarina longa]
MRKLLFFKLTFLVIFLTIYSQKVYSQSTLHPLSFKANQGNYEDSYSEYYYSLQKEGNTYRLVDPKGRDVLQRACDTILKNAHFIKAIQKDSFYIYKNYNLEALKIPNAKQVYFIRDGLEVLTTQGPQYYDNTITKINNFPKLDLFACGNVYSKRYTLSYNKESKKHTILLSFGDFGEIRTETILDLKGIPYPIEKLSFITTKNYISESINSSYNKSPHLIKITKEGKSGIYSYTIDQATYPPKKAKEKPDYFIDETTGDTIFEPIAIVPISFLKKGSVMLQEVLPLVYDRIQMDSNNGLIYLYKDNLIGIYPNHISTTFEVFERKTSSFYRIVKDGKQGWIDIRTFKEYYF